MFDILESILYGENLGLMGKYALEPPYTAGEKRILSLLQTLDGETARRLEEDIRLLAHERHDQGFHSGVRFGAQLMLQLSEGF